MKKVIAVLLAVLCVVSLLSIALSAAAEKDEDTIVYAIVYSSGGYQLMYTPTPSYRFDKPGTVTVSDDIPLAVDYKFAYWIDKDGKHYYPGDKIEVDREVKLQAVMVPKDDGDSHTTRVIKTALQALVRVLSNAFGFFKKMEGAVPR